MKLTSEQFNQLEEAFSTMLFGGPSDPPDHTYWAGTEFLNFLDSIGVEYSPEQKKMIDETRKLCHTEGDEGSCFELPDDE